MNMPARQTDGGHPQTPPNVSHSGDDLVWLSAKLEPLGRMFGLRDPEQTIGSVIADVAMRYAGQDRLNLLRLSAVTLRRRAIREQARHRKHSQPEEGYPQAQSGSLDDPAVINDLREMRQVINAEIVRLLTPDQQRLVLDHYYGGKAVAEIALSIGVSKATAYRLLTDALASLARAMRDFQDLLDL